MIRKSPRRWWFYFWLVSLPLGLLLVFVAATGDRSDVPQVRAAEQKDPALVTSLEKMVQRAGENIPPERMFWMGASEKSTELNAYVTGFGASKRIVVWDTTIAKMNTPQIVFVAGTRNGPLRPASHSERADHFRCGFVRSLLSRLSFTGWLLARRGARWDIRGMDDWASLPALLLLLGLFSFVVTPLSNAISRHFEHQADQYGLEVTHGLTPDSGQVAAQALQVLGEVSLDDPTPSPLDIILTYNHPSIRDRVRYCLTYDPWANGGHGEFVP